MFEQLHNFLSTTPFTDYRIILLLVGCGAVVGFINTIAGMATAISYGLFMMMGLPINVANGTTRVGVLLQFITTSVIFKKKGYLDMKTGWKVGIPVGCGAIFGALLAAVLHVKVIEIVMAILLPIMSILLFIDRKKVAARRSAAEPVAPQQHSGEPVSPQQHPSSDGSVHAVKTEIPASSAQNAVPRNPMMQDGHVHAVRLTRASSVPTAEQGNPTAHLCTNVTSADGNPKIP